eukprot:CAMPEP_0168626824 /NCGR_PEP_ID=MMETSP0449_2-20121227/10862_1 /TAXON_ID=1082188 /ORGANISM="Strombidium rassoulzadegani, Strain ras09" /LENGTH=35 /DNA_ID= /DNA_START= /DNA_END= /DNA_ORIENTATION=
MTTAREKAPIMPPFWAYFVSSLCNLKVCSCEPSTI